MPHWEKFQSFSASHILGRVFIASSQTSIPGRPGAARLFASLGFYAHQLPAVPLVVADACRCASRSAVDGVQGVVQQWATSLPTGQLQLDRLHRAVHVPVVVCSAIPCRSSHQVRRHSLQRHNTRSTCALSQELHSILCHQRRHFRRLSISDLQLLHEGLLVSLLHALNLYVYRYRTTGARTGGENMSAQQKHW